MDIIANTTKGTTIIAVAPSFGAKAKVNPDIIASFPKFI